MSTTTAQPPIKQKQHHASIHYNNKNKNVKIVPQVQTILLSPQITGGYESFKQRKPQTGYYTIKVMI